MNEQELDSVLNDDYEIGDLCLGIYCTKCDAQFELGKEAVSMAVMMKTPFWDYVKYIQSSKCPKCNHGE